MNLQLYNSPTIHGENDLQVNTSNCRRNIMIMIIIINIDTISNNKALIDKHDTLRLIQTYLYQMIWMHEVHDLLFLSRYFKVTEFRI